MEYRESVALLARCWRNRFSADKRLWFRGEVYFPDRRVRDLDNLFKALFDSLQWAKVFVNDNQIRKIWMEDMGLAKPGYVEIMLVEME